MKRCPRCALLKPLLEFKDPGNTGKVRSTCLVCRHKHPVAENIRTCHGLPKSWGLPACEEKTTNYRCPACTKIWNERHGVDPRNHNNEGDFTGGLGNGYTSGRVYRGGRG